MEEKRSLKRMVVPTVRVYLLLLLISEQEKLHSSPFE